MARSARDKVFGYGRPRPLDREGKVRLMTLARALMRRREKGKHWGPVTAKSLAVLEALLWGFHNAQSGLCFPSYDRIAELAGCARSTVGKAIKALENAGLLTWVNRLVRQREHGPTGWRIRVLRTSNGYRFHDPRIGEVASKTDLLSGTRNQFSFKEKGAVPPKEPPTDRRHGRDRGTPSATTGYILALGKSTMTY